MTEREFERNAEKEYPYAQYLRDFKYWFTVGFESWGKAISHNGKLSDEAKAVLEESLFCIK